MIVLLIHLIITWVLAGISWYAQIDQYPLLCFVGKKELPQYQKEYYRRTMPPAIVLLVVELITALWISLSYPIFGGMNLALLAIIWILTFGGCVKCHVALQCEIADLKKLLRINFLRACLWTIRGIIIAVLFWALYS